MASPHGGKDKQKRLLNFVGYFNSIIGYVVPCQNGCDRKILRLCGAPAVTRAQSVFVLAQQSEPNLLWVTPEGDHLRAFSDREKSRDDFSNSF